MVAMLRAFPVMLTVFLTLSQLVAADKPRYRYCILILERRALFLRWLVFLPPPVARGRDFFNVGGSQPGFRMRFQLLLCPVCLQRGIPFITGAESFLGEGEGGHAVIAVAAVGDSQLTPGKCRIWKQPYNMFEMRLRFPVMLLCIESQQDPR